jgi:hypothetical protein
MAVDVTDIVIQRNHCRPCGQVLVKYWSNTGRCWSNAGRVAAIAHVLPRMMRSSLINLPLLPSLMGIRHPSCCHA